MTFGRPSMLIIPCFDSSTNSNFVQPNLFLTPGCEKIMAERNVDRASLPIDVVEWTDDEGWASALNTSLMKLLEMQEVVDISFVVEEHRTHPVVLDFLKGMATSNLFNITKVSFSS